MHGIGGTLLQHLKEHQLHCDIAGERIFYFTTCGWMMWNWLVSALASGATWCSTMVPPLPGWQRAVGSGTGRRGRPVSAPRPSISDALHKQGYAPINTHDLPALRLICSTGSVLSPEGVDYVYQQIKQNVQLSSISGGTDICPACHRQPLSPLHRGESQGGLGLAVQVFNEVGQPVLGERANWSVPSLPGPAHLLGDENGDKYHAAYFERFDNIWCHGDWIELTPTGGVLFTVARRDPQPGGVRIGTSEIYRYVEQLDEVKRASSSASNGNRTSGWCCSSSSRRAGWTSLRERICQQIKRHCTARHVPARILQVDAIPAPSPAR